MKPADFRRDRRLRTSGYHLATWSLAAFVLEARALAMQGHAGAGSGAVMLIVIAGSVLSSLTHERRVGKMTGPAGETVFDSAARLWAVVFMVLGVVSVWLAAGGQSRWLFPLWMLGVGLGFTIWGSRAAFGWYVFLGVAMAVAAALDVGLAVAGWPHRPLRLAVLGLALPAAALMTNRRYLWFR